MLLKDCKHYCKNKHISSNIVFRIDDQIIRSKLQISNLLVAELILHGVHHGTACASADVEQSIEHCYLYTLKHT
jgi:hypothetical protein